jgi:hypothetical protein
MKVANNRDVRVVRAREGVFSCDLDDGRALLDLESSKYFRLNPTAEYVWQCLERGPATPTELAQELAQHFEITAEDCLADVENLIDSFAGAGLVVFSGA